jgi:hypothetical protein
MSVCLTETKCVATCPAVLYEGQFLVLTLKLVRGRTSGKATAPCCAVFMRGIAKQTRPNLDSKVRLQTHRMNVDHSNLAQRSDTHY